MILFPPISFGEDFMKLELKNKSINFYNLVPLYTEEVDLKLKKGADAIIENFDKFNIDDVLDLNRKNTALRKKRFGLF